jgi:hypothetical protein
MKTEDFYNTIVDEIDRLDGSIRFDSWEVSMVPDGGIHIEIAKGKTWRLYTGPYGYKIPQIVDMIQKEFI